MNGLINYTIEEITKLTGGKLINYNAKFPKPVNIALDSRKIISPSTTIFLL